MILGIGIDLLHLPRLRSLVQRRGVDRLARRILSSVEWNQFRTLDTPLAQENYLVTRWTAKEAAYKALCSHHRVTWKELTITKDDKKPVIKYLAKESGDAVRLHLSVTHDGDYVASYVIAESV